MRGSAVTVEDDLLCVADTKLVMGNWLAETVMNGRSLPDFAAMLGMCTTSYGQARALYQFLTDGQEAYAALERGRGPDEIRSMNLLDAPPRNWADLVLTIWLAERATWTLMSALLQHPDRRVAALARKVGEEAYFHLKYAAGWFKVLAADNESAAELAAALARRLPLAADWFGPAGASDPLTVAGQRAAATDDELKDRFLRDVAADLKAAGVSGPGDARPAVDEPPGTWRPAARRRGPLPPGLFEVIRFKDQAIAH
jgi:ring-1,2-phenylacetyl-CoA epoxidase subunit PaaC